MTMSKHPGTVIRSSTTFQDAKYKYSLRDAKKMTERINIPNPLGIRGPSEIAILRDVCLTLLDKVTELENAKSL